MIKDQFGHLYKKPLNSFSVADFEDWKNKATTKTGKALAKSSLIRHTNNIRKVFSNAVTLKRIEQNPMTNFKRHQLPISFTPTG